MGWLAEVETYEAAILLMKEMSVKIRDLGKVTDKAV